MFPFVLLQCVFRRADPGAPSLSRMHRPLCCSGFTWEIIVVDDGSAKDQTAAYVNRNYVKKHGSDK